MLDDKFKIEQNGHEFSVTDFQDLLKKVETQEMQISKLTAKHLTCKQSDRQKVRLATELLSNSTACLMKDHFPECPKKKQLSDIISLLDKGFNVMTSKLTNIDHPDVSKRPLGSNVSEQFTYVSIFIAVT